MIAQGSLTPRQARQYNHRVPVDSETVPVGSLAPDFTLESITGDTVTLSDLRGDPVVLVFLRGFR
jgi:hypothetical protein